MRPHCEAFLYTRGRTFKIVIIVERVHPERTMKINLSSPLGSLSRRGFVRVGSAAAATCVVGTGCGSSGGQQTTAATGGTGNGAAGGTGANGQGESGAGGQGFGGQGVAGQGTAGAGGEPTPECGPPTEDDIEGPFYTPGAPAKSTLVEPGMPGVLLTIAGRVTDTDCQPIANAILDVWQADDAGGYDTNGFLLRGIFTTDADGRYEIKSIVPGHYLNGAQYRPAHVHVKASGPGFASLTTQLYFEGDPYNEIDPFIDDALIMPVTDVSANEKACEFDFVLLPA
jgi:protocatechuate 3,4-dioxygenase beta subunit